jgi:hypothetical protein
LTDLLHDLASSIRPEDKVVVLALSFELNSSLLSLISPEVGRKIVEVGAVDARDGFNMKRFMDADILILTKSPEILLPVEHQQNIVIPTTAILSGSSPLAKNYKLLLPSGYRLSNGNIVYVYRRFREPSGNEVAWLKKRFLARYPQWMYNSKLLGN